MTNQKKTIGCGTFILLWIIVSMVLGVFFSAINKTEQSIGNIVFMSVVFGFFLAFLIWLFWSVIRTKKNMRNQNQLNSVSDNETFIPQSSIIPMSSAEYQKAPQETPKVLQPVSSVTVMPVRESANTETKSMTDSIQNQYKFQSKAVDKSCESDKKAPKCNCDGCPKQNVCEYGHVVYDEITKKRMSLFDKFMMVIIGSSANFNVITEDFGIIATNEELHNKKLLLKLDKDVLHNTLNYLHEIKKAYYEFGKCGKAYFNFMKMGDEISLVKDAIREYDEYQVILRQMDLAKLYVLDRVSKDGEFQQEEVYKVFPDIDRKYLTSAMRELDKSERIIRKSLEKHT